MNVEYLLSGTRVRYRDFEYLVEPAWSQNCWIKHVCSVRGGEHKHFFQLLDAVQFGQELTQDALCDVRITRASASCRYQGIDFVEENDAGSRLLGFPEDLTNSAFRLTYVFRKKCWSLHRNEVHFGLIGYGLG